MPGIEGCHNATIHEKAMIRVRILLLILVSNFNYFLIDHLGLITNNKLIIGLKPIIRLTIGFPKNSAIIRRVFTVYSSAQVLQS